MFLALTALVDEPRHGYGIVQEVDRLSGGRVQLKIGSLYGVLDRLAGEGLVALDREEVAQGRLRRYYRLTDSGAGALEEEAARLTANARAATARLRERTARLRPGTATATATATAFARILAGNVLFTWRSHGGAVADAGGAG
jgi:DNA-binding PadR family transcriptional regulator